MKLNVESNKKAIESDKNNEIIERKSGIEKLSPKSQEMVDALNMIAEESRKLNDKASQVSSLNFDTIRISSVIDELEKTNQQILEFRNQNFNNLLQIENSFKNLSQNPDLTDLSKEMIKNIENISNDSDNILDKIKSRLDDAIKFKELSGDNVLNLGEENAYSTIESLFAKSRDLVEEKDLLEQKLKQNEMKINFEIAKLEDQKKGFFGLFRNKSNLDNQIKLLKEDALRNKQVAESEIIRKRNEIVEAKDMRNLGLEGKNISKKMQNRINDINNKLSKI